MYKYKSVLNNVFNRIYFCGRLETVKRECNVYQQCISITVVSKMHSNELILFFL